MCCASEKSKRRTKTVAGTLEPKWNQAFVYSPMKRSDLSTLSLEITVYDYDRIGSGEYVGEVCAKVLMSTHLHSPYFYWIVARTGVCRCRVSCSGFLGSADVLLKHEGI